MSVALDHAQQTCLADAIGSDLRGQISFAFIGCTHVRKDHRKNFLIDDSLFDQLYGRDDQAFLEDFTCERHGARTHAADIRMMCAIRSKEGRMQ